jgi:hypothetical protein
MLSTIHPLVPTIPHACPHYTCPDSIMSRVYVHSVRSHPCRLPPGTIHTANVDVLHPVALLTGACGWERCLGGKCLQGSTPRFHSLAEKG